MNHTIVLFDSECMLCNSMVQFIIKRNHKLRFASLQSQTGEKLLESFGYLPGNLNSLVLLENDKIFVKSKAVLHIIRKLDRFWPLLYVLNIIPLFIRDKVYDKIAANRFKWFRKTKNCMLPTLFTLGRIIE
jgi:predicted DCC family thiol-disulfide oxidoreductase YuxK